MKLRAYFDESQRPSEFLQDPDATVEAGIREHARRRRLGLLLTNADLERLPRVLVDRLLGYRELARTQLRDEQGLGGATTVDVMRSRGFASLTDLGRLFGGEDRDWAELCETHRLAGAKRGPSRGKELWRVPLETVDELSIMFRSTLSVAETAGYLRLAPFQVWGLERMRVLRRCFEGSGTLLRRYRIAEVEQVSALLEALSEPAYDWEAPAGLQPLAYVCATDRLRSSCTRWAARLERILTGVDPLFQTHPLTTLGFQAYAAPVRRSYGALVPPLRD